MSKLVAWIFFLLIYNVRFDFLHIRTKVRVHLEHSIFHMVHSGCCFFCVDEDSWLAFSCESTLVSFPYDRRRRVTIFNHWPMFIYVDYFCIDLRSIRVKCICDHRIHGHNPNLCHTQSKDPKGITRSFVNDLTRRFHKTSWARRYTFSVCNDNEFVVGFANASRSTSHQAYC